MTYNREKITITYLIFSLLLCSGAEAITRTWTGGGADNLASTSANWSGGVAPQNGDDVVFNSTSRDCEWDLNVTLNSLGIYSEYLGTVTLSPTANIAINNFSDSDGDGIIDIQDNCPLNANPGQENADSDNLGDACDADNDNDGLIDYEEEILGTNPYNPDTDGDGVDDLNDAFPLNPLETKDSDGKERQITTDPSYESSPAVSGNRIVWQDYRNGNFDIYMYDISMGTETQITTDISDQYSPAISGNRIVWGDYRNGHSDIYMFDISTGVETQITVDPEEAPADQYSPVISGNHIVWEDYRNGVGNIYMYDISTGIETQIATNEQYNLAISGNRIVWEVYGDNNYDIYMYDISTMVETRITMNDNDQYSPAISGNQIVWEDYRNGDPVIAPYNYDIYMFDILTGVETRITTNDNQQAAPAISGNRVVWDDYRNGNDDIYMFDISTGIEYNDSFRPIFPRYFREPYCLGRW
jgi:beta propeller repeat protein